MARRRRKISLYEVISKAQLKLSYNKMLERVHPKKSGEDKPIAPDSTAQVSKKPTFWPTKLRIVQFNAGRIEISIPYQLAIALLLGIILLLLVVFRLGQSSQSQQGVTAPEKKTVWTGEGGLKSVNLSAVQAPKLTIAADKPESEVIRKAAGSAAMPAADNVIVLVEYRVRADLVPVQEHFAAYGIGTEIVLENGRYFLITKDKYDNPDKPGTGGYKAKRRIIGIGAKYKNKAPEGYETFAPNYFRDAYGKKVK